MEWTRSETLAIASEQCTQCHGMGLRHLKGGASHPCNCVFRAIFRACYMKFIHCISKEKRFSQVTLDNSPRGGRRITWGRKDEEYVADFLLVSKRQLTAEEYMIFRYHFLLGADWKLCVWRLKMDRGTFFHMVYRIMQKLGRAFRELKPYALYPLDEYFHGRTENQEPGLPASLRVVPLRKDSLNRRLKVPVKRAA
jgi:hypothetical protein